VISPVPRTKGSVLGSPTRWGDQPMYYEKSEESGTQKHDQSADPCGWDIIRRATACQLGYCKRDMCWTDLKGVGPEPHQKADTIVAHTTPTTSTRQETHCDTCTPTTSSSTASAYPATNKDACWELQHKRPVWLEPCILGREQCCELAVFKCTKIISCYICDLLSLT